MTVNKGFSMVELMVVVAIVGVLSAVAIPQYSKFQAKARQSEAKLSLAALYTVEESFRQEWNQFSKTLSNVGFSVQGTRLRYRTGFHQGAGCVGYTTAAGAPAESITSAFTWSDGANVNSQGATWSVTILEPLDLGPTDSTCTSSTFTAIAYGDPGSSTGSLSSTGGDSWSLNQVKLIQNTSIFLGN